MCIRDRYNSDLTTTVTGIVKDLNENNSFNASEFISLPTIPKTGLQKQFMMDDWGDWMAYSQLYVKLTKGNDVKKLEAVSYTHLDVYKRQVIGSRLVVLYFTQRRS